MGKVTTGGNHQPGADVPEDVQLPVQENVQEPAEEEPAPEEPAAEAADDDRPDYSAYATRDLIALCKERGVPYSGPSGTLPKAELVARLTAQEG